MCRVSQSSYLLISVTFWDVDYDSRTRHDADLLVWSHYNRNSRRPPLDFSPTTRRSCGASVLSHMLNDCSIPDENVKVLIRGSADAFFSSDVMRAIAKYADTRTDMNGFVQETLQCLPFVHYFRFSALYPFRRHVNCLRCCHNLVWYHI